MNEFVEVFNETRKLFNTFCEHYIRKCNNCPKQNEIISTFVELQQKFNREVLPSYESAIRTIAENNEKTMQARKVIAKAEQEAREKVSQARYDVSTELRELKEKNFKLTTQKNTLQEKVEFLESQFKETKADNRVLGEKLTRQGVAIARIAGFLADERKAEQGVINNAEPLKKRGKKKEDKVPDRGDLPTLEEEQEEEEVGEVVY
jgi:hypothetical protein